MRKVKSFAAAAVRRSRMLSLKTPEILFTVFLPSLYVTVLTIKKTD